LSGCETDELSFFPWLLGFKGQSGCFLPQGGNAITHGQQLIIVIVSVSWQGVVATSSL
jgi:hypothetical protein